MTRREKDARDLDLAFATLVIGLAPLLTIHVAYAEHPIPPVESLPAVEYRSATETLWFVKARAVLVMDLAANRYEGPLEEHNDENLR